MGGGGIWRVASAINATKRVQINDGNAYSAVLEGALTLPTDASTYGPCTGKILICGESVKRIFAIDPSANVTAYDFVLAKPEDPRLMAPRWNRYCVDNPHNQEFKVPQSTFGPGEWIRD